LGDPKFGRTTVGHWDEDRWDRIALKIDIVSAIFVSMVDMGAPSK